MKTKEEDNKSLAGAEVVFARLRCAEGARRSNCTLVLGCHFGTSHPFHFGVCAGRRIGGTKPECI